ncbi:zinc finger protein 862-like [Labeo rohita]|uniref:Zinc finger protein 862-like n=1 Tax=Labeo rohita TaxID=84645 RepID=A0A498MX70_LABRO|nr:zinc finger protein 862-like [Labeo rohita]
MDAFLRPKNYFLADKVTAAEVTSVYHTVQHATSYRAGDCGTKLAPTIYPDSDIAKRMACGRTMAEAIVTDVLAPASVEDCLKVLKRPLNEQREATTKAHTPFFSVASDASNHGTTKLFPLSVRYWTPDLGVQMKVLDFYDDSDETSAAIHNQIVTKLEENGLGLDMISAYSADNASLNYGRYNSVFQKLKENNGCILKANCVAHIVHNSAKHAGDRLNIDIENVVNKTFSHFSSSAKRIEELKSIHTFVEIEVPA